MALSTLVVGLLLSGTGAARLAEDVGQSEGPELEVSLLQRQLHLSRGRASPWRPWAGKNGDVLRSGASTVVLPSLTHRAPNWTWTADAIVRASPIVDESGIYVSNVHGAVRKFARSGAQLWTRQLSPGLPGNAVLDDNVLYAVTEDCRFWALSASDGAVLWTQTAGSGQGPDTPSTVAAQGVVAAACFGPKERLDFGGATFVVALDAKSGKQLWSYRAPWPLYNWMGSITQDSLLFADTFGGVYRLNLWTGEEIWKLPPPVPDTQRAGTTGGLTAASNGLVYVTNNIQNSSGKHGQLRAYEALSGAPRWRRDFALPCTAAAAGDGEAVALALGPNPAMATANGLQEVEGPSWDHRKPEELVELDAASGRLRWRVTLPDWLGPAAGDTAEHSCLPDAFANPVLAGDGAVYVAAASGKVYRVLDANRDGAISQDEVSSYDAGNGFQGAPAIGDQLLAIAPCNGLQVFLF